MKPHSKERKAIEALIDSGKADKLTVIQIIEKCGGHRSTVYELLKKRKNQGNGSKGRLLQTFKKDPYFLITKINHHDHSI